MSKHLDVEIKFYIRFGVESRSPPNSVYYIKKNASLYYFHGGPNVRLTSVSNIFSFRNQVTCSIIITSNDQRHTE